MSGTRLPAIAGASAAAVAAPPSADAEHVVLPALTHDKRTNPARPDHTEAQAQAGGMLRNLLGLSEAEQQAIEAQEERQRERDALVAAAQAAEAERLVKLSATNEADKAKSDERMSKREAMLRQIHAKAAAKEEEKIMGERSPDRLDDGAARYGYFSPTDTSPALALTPGAGAGAQPPVQQRADSELSASDASPGGGEDETVAPLSLVAQVAGGPRLPARGALAKRKTMQLAVKKVIRSSGTPGFIMLERLANKAGKDLARKERDFWRLIKKHYAVIKKEQQMENKRSGRMALLKGDLKARALLVDKFKAAVRAVCAAREEQGPQLAKELASAVAAERILKNSPEFRAVQQLQRVARRAQPLAFHPGIGPSMPLAAPLHRGWSAHVVVCRLAKARASADRATIYASDPPFGELHVGC